MPRYAYTCDRCNVEFLTIHSIDEVLETCKECAATGTLTKLLTKPSYGIKKRGADRVGKITEDFIEDSRQELKKQRRDLDKQR
jgi:putative FmdB family regulatory protein